MINMNDVYFKVGSKLKEQGFYEKSVEEKKDLVDKGLKDYAIEKIAEIGIASVLTSEYRDQVSLIDLVGVLGAMIPEDQHYDTLRHLTHFVLLSAGDIQGHYVIWWGENDRYCKGRPIATFDTNGFWENISTYEDDDYVETFNFTYDLFLNQFMKKHKVNKKTIMSQKDGEN